MEGPSRSSHKYLVLQVWCGLLTVALVGMAAFLVSNRSKPVEKSISSPLEQKNVSTPGRSSLPPLDLVRASPSYIELVISLGSPLWKPHLTCSSCSLTLKNNSIYSNRSSSAPSLYFIYAQVSFKEQSDQNKSVSLIRNGSPGKAPRKLVQVRDAAGGFVWVGRIIQLKKGESIRLNISGDINGEDTFWGAFQLY